MMIGRYVIAVDRKDCDRGGVTARYGRLVEQYGLDEVFSSTGLVVLTTRETPVMRGTNGRWLAIGQLFPGACGEGARAVADQETPDDLLTCAWGGYVAVDASPDGAVPRISRDPSGARSCWMIRGPDCTIFTDDARMGVAMAAAETPSIDSVQVATLLLYPDLRGPETPLARLEEVQPGTARSYDRRDDRWRIHISWSPWRFTEPTNWITDPNEASTAIRQAVDQAVQGWATTARRPLVELSGGLDSSIVAASLSASGLPLSATTLVTPSSDGDERDYAALVAGSLGGSLIETFAEAAMVDLRRSAAKDLPRPAARAFAQAGDRLAVASAGESDADAFFSGGGGDNVFAYFNSALPAADHLRTAGPGNRAFKTIADAAQLTRRTIWQTARRAMNRAWWDRSLPLWRRDPSMLTHDVHDLAMPTHPWLTPARDALPGKHWHIRSLITIQNHLEGYDRGGLPLVFPLLAQPLVETALRIPSWLWIEGGRDRAVARRAFDDRLPRSIVQRRTKGGLDSLAEAVFRHHRDVLTEMLLDGWLAASGVVDRGAMEAALSSGAPGHRLRLLALADVEAWGRYWR